MDANQLVDAACFAKFVEKAALTLDHTTLQKRTRKTVSRPTPDDNVVDLCETLDRARVIADGGYYKHSSISRTRILAAA